MSLTKPAVNLLTLISSRNFWPPAHDTVLSCLRSRLPESFRRVDFMRLAFCEVSAQLYLSELKGFSTASSKAKVEQSNQHVMIERAVVWTAESLTRKSRVCGCKSILPRHRM